MVAVPVDSYLAFIGAGNHAEAPCESGVSGNYGIVVSLSWIFLGIVASRLGGIFDDSFVLPVGIFFLP